MDFLFKHMFKLAAVWAFICLVVGAGFAYLLVRVALKYINS